MLPQLGDVIGQLGDQRDELIAENGRDHDAQQHQREHEHADDDERGEQPVDAELLDVVRERVEQVRDRHSGDEGQQDIAEQP